MSFPTRNGITNVATNFLTFKSKILINYMDNQWQLLTKHELNSNPDYIQVSQETIENYAETLVENSQELIFAVDSEGALVLQSLPFLADPEELRKLGGDIRGREPGWNRFSLGSEAYISDINYFEPFDWYVVNAVRHDAFYGAVTKIVYRTVLIFLISLSVSIALLFIFSRYLTTPLHSIVDVIRKIIKSDDLSIKVRPQYQDEIGELGHYFNIMTDELDAANRQIKSYALKAVISQRKELKIRNIFQKYVPRNVIDRFYLEPESMLEGDSRVLGILFSDIRSFTSFSENLPPYEVVESLNKYFEYMVDVILKHEGIVDKYIGDAIMAFFGAPVHHENDAYQAVISGLEMMDLLGEFNNWQSRYGRSPFKIGIGINYGYVTIGNIGTDKKMDYTIIGDMVNLASRLEGLTKIYREPIIISASVYQKIQDQMPCRTIDKVVVKGKSAGSNIYTVRRGMTPKEIDAWCIHEEAIEHYYKRDFSLAMDKFAAVHKLMRQDYTSLLFQKRCLHYLKNPPDENWTGAILLNQK